MTVESKFLPGSSIELINNFTCTRQPRHALFDFDGTLSLIREGWPDVMIPMMVEVLQSTGTDESPEQLNDVATGFVMELNGKQTIYQMIRLAEEVQHRGGQPLDPLVYKNEYHDRLMQRIETRREALRTGRAEPQAMVVPGCYDMLDRLQAAGIKLYLASGTDEKYVQEEVRLLGLDIYFGDHVYGAVDDYHSFSKAKVIEKLLEQHGVIGEELIGFGDGYVEIQNVRAVNGTAIAVASDEANRSGKPDKWKRERLIGAGANVVIPDFAEAERLMSLVLNGAPGS